MDTFNMKQWLIENKIGPYKISLNEGLGDAQAEADQEMQQQDDQNSDQVDNVSMGVTAETRNTMPFQHIQPNEKMYNIQRDDQGYIIGATNQDGDTFSVGDKAITADRQPIEIKGFIGQQGKVKAIYYSMPGQVAHTYDIDGLEKEMDEQIGVGYVSKVKSANEPHDIM